MLSKEFMTAGKATFTIEIPDSLRDAEHKAHYTFRITKKEASEQYKECYFVSMLTGSDNESDYTYMGMLDAESGKLILTKKSAYPQESYPVRLLSRTLVRVWANEQQAVITAGFKLHHEGRCGRCNRLLTTPESCETGIGPECRKRLLSA